MLENFRKIGTFLVATGMSLTMASHAFATGFEPLPMLKNEYKKNYKLTLNRHNPGILSVDCDEGVVHYEEPQNGTMTRVYNSKRQPDLSYKTEFYLAGEHGHQYGYDYLNDWGENSLVPEFCNEGYERPITPETVEKAGELLNYILGD